MPLSPLRRIPPPPPPLAAKSASAAPKHDDFESDHVLATNRLWATPAKPASPAFYGAHVKRFLLAVVVGGSSLSAAFPLAHADTSATRCGIERWAVKTLTDPAARRVSFVPRTTTVTALRALRVPHVGGRRPRRRVRRAVRAADRGGLPGGRVE